MARECSRVQWRERCPACLLACLLVETGPTSLAGYLTCHLQYRPLVTRSKHHLPAGSSIPISISIGAASLDLPFPVRPPAADGPQTQGLNRPRTPSAPRSHQYRPPLPCSRTTVPIGPFGARPPVDDHHRAPFCLPTTSPDPSSVSVSVRRAKPCLTSLAAVCIALTDSRARTTVALFEALLRTSWVTAGIYTAPPYTGIRSTSAPTTPPPIILTA
jgi:hypothetical protein